MKNCFGEKLKVKHILSRNYYFDTTRMSYKTYTYSRVRDFWLNPSGKVPPKELDSSSYIVAKEIVHGLTN